MTNKKENKKENGAIVVEATIAFTTFIFCILTILMIIDVAYVQAKVGTALNMSAKEMSQYTYLYYRLKFDQVYDASARASKDSKELARETSDSINELWGSMNTITDTATTWKVWKTSWKTWAMNLKTLWGNTKSNLVILRDL